MFIQKNDDTIRDLTFEGLYHALSEDGGCLWCPICSVANVIDQNYNLSSLSFVEVSCINCRHTIVEMDVDMQTVRVPSRWGWDGREDSFWDARI